MKRPGRPHDAQQGARARVRTWVGTSPPVETGATVALVAGEVRTLADEGSVLRR
jgi:hypothetical protein